MSWLGYGGAVGCARDGLSAAVARLRVCVCYLWVVNFFFFWGEGGPRQRGGDRGRILLYIMEEKTFGV